MTDLSKIDWSRLTLPDWSGDRVHCVWSRTYGGVLLKRNGFVFASLKPGGVWTYDQGPWALLEVARTYTDRVDRYIAEESARIAREEEAVNFVPVPWQDVAWLSNGGASVQYLDDEIRKWVEFPCQFNASGRSRCSYRADRRTLPSGYDPTKPRWVEIDWTQVERLDKAGCQLGDVADKSYGYRPRKPGLGAGKRDWCYAVDIHTLPPGVQLNPGTVAEIDTPIVIDKAGYVRDARTDEVIGYLVIFG